MSEHESSHIEGALAHRAGAGGDAARLAQALAAMYEEIDAALTPVIGARGVAALYLRSLRLVCAAHPWMAPGPALIPARLDVTSLCATLARQSPEAALAGGEALLISFHGLLASLVGPSLTQRMLHSVWSQEQGNPSAQDTSP